MMNYVIKITLTYRQKLKKLTFSEQPTSSNTESRHILKEKMFEMFGPSI